MGFRSSLLLVPNIDSVDPYCSTPQLHFDEVAHELQVVVADEFHHSIHIQIVPNLM